MVESFVEKYFREKGFAQGREEGITLGEQRARSSIMETLMANGMDPQQAAHFTGLTVQDVC